VTKRKVSFALILMLVVTGLIVAMLPAAAVAAPGIVELNWSEAAFEGNDAFYGGVAVVAYEAGSTAKMEFRVKNDSTADLTVRGAKATFDWGTCNPTVPATFPFVLKAGEYASFRFECVVPADASNQTLHNYKVAVEYEGMAGPGIASRINWEAVVGFNLANDVAVPGAVTLWDVTPTGALVIPVDKYNVAYMTGAISWVAPYPGPTGTLYAAYDYIDFLTGWAQGNGVNKVFKFQTDATKLPIVPDSVKVVKAVGVPVNSVTKVDTGWSVDLQTGTLTFTDAPASYEAVGVFYKYYNSFVGTGANLAVYSADQADAQALAAQWTNMNAAGVPPVFWLPLSTTAGAQSLSDSKVLAAQAAAKYAAGDFAGAKADYQSAVDGLNTAYTANGALNTTAETGVASLLTNAGGAIDAYRAKLNGEASMSKNLGVFYIMLGVATLLAGLAGIMWAFSRLVGARDSTLHEHH
jgi:hypothetical protein